MPERIRSLLVANRGEIAIRVMRAATELGIRTVAIYSQEDRFSLHRMKADESYLVGAGKTPVEAYLDIDDIVRIAQAAQVDAIHPGYGFLSENPEFAEACAAAGLIFVGPTPEIMRRLGNKVMRAQARGVRRRAGDAGDAAAAARRCRGRCGWRARSAIPVMLKASWGGGGRGMRVVEQRSELAGDGRDRAARSQGGVRQRRGVSRKARARARGTSKCSCSATRTATSCTCSSATAPCSGAIRKWSSARRRRSSTTEQRRDAVRSRRSRSAAPCSYLNAGTVEFLQDADTGKFYFIEVNPRVQVEHTVTEAVTGIDIVRAQIRIAEGAAIGDARQRRAARRRTSASTATRCSAA